MESVGAGFASHNPFPHSIESRPKEEIDLRMNIRTYEQTNSNNHNIRSIPVYYMGINKYLKQFENELI